MPELRCPKCGEDFNDADRAEYELKQEADKKFKLEYSRLISWKEFFRTFFLGTMIVMILVGPLLGPIHSSWYLRLGAGTSVLAVVIFMALDIYCEIKKKKFEAKLRRS